MVLRSPGLFMCATAGALMLAAALGAAPASAQDAPASAARFQLVNNTGSVATAMHAVRSGTQGWGPNLVEGRGLRPGTSMTVIGTPAAGCLFDLRMVLIDRAPLERRAVDVCQNTRVVFSTTEAAAPARPDSMAGKPSAGERGIQPDPGSPGGGMAGIAPGPGAPTQPEPPRGRLSSGTGFLVAEGRALTNNHVIEQCSRVVARNAQGREMPAQIVARDTQLDLALLSLARDAGPVLSFRDSPVVRRGDEVVTYGFPLSGLLSSGPTLTRGDVSALAGLRDDQNQLQISAPVQPGNSGGPLLDRTGNVVGVVVSKLNAQRVAERTGDIPQNVNFAIKADRAVGFLRRHGVSPRLAVSGAERPAAEVGEIAHPSTLFLQCFR